MFYGEKAKIDITLQRRRPFKGKIYQMKSLSSFEMRKMKVEGTWCTEDIDNEDLKLRVFSAVEKNSLLISLMNATSCFSRWAKKVQRRNSSFTSKNTFI